MPIARFIACLLLITVALCALLIACMMLLGKQHRGTEIAYVVYEDYYAAQGSQSSDIWLLDVERHISLQLIAEALNPRWSPDGEQLLFVAFYDDTSSSEITVLDLRTNEIRRLTHTYSDEGILLWMPNSDQILLSRFQRAPDGLIYVLLDTLTGEISDFERPTPSANILSWSPDGRFMIYIQPVLGAGYETVIWDTILDQMNIGIPPTVLAIDAHAWSPDSQQLVGIGRDSLTNSQQIYITPITENALRQISTGGVFNSFPSWSPDGRFIAYSQSIQGCCVDGDLMLINLATGEQSLLAHHNAAATNPVWRP